MDPSTPNTIIGVQLNCQSLNTKLYDTKKLIYKIKPTFACFCETWINNCNRTPNFVDYHTIWRHRYGPRGGGLGILVRRGVQHSELPLKYYKDGGLEAQAVKIFDRHNNPITILNVYKPPNKNLTLLELRHYIKQLGPKYIITGDFNAHSPILDDRINNPDQAGKVIEDLILKDDVCLINPPNFYTRIAFTKK